MLQRKFRTGEARRDPPAERVPRRDAPLDDGGLVGDVELAPAGRLGIDVHLDGEIVDQPAPVGHACAHAHPGADEEHQVAAARQLGELRRVRELARVEPGPRGGAGAAHRARGGEGLGLVGHQRHVEIARRRTLLERGDERAQDVAGALVLAARAGAEHGQRDEVLGAAVTRRRPAQVIGHHVEPAPRRGRRPRGPHRRRRADGDQPRR